jgi:uncharacterized RDD family membrane protein YckC
MFIQIILNIPALLQKAKSWKETVMSSLDPYNLSLPTTNKYLRRKCPHRPIRVSFARTNHKILAWLIDAALLSALFILFKLHWALWLVASILYFTLFETFLGASLGEYLMGIRIIHRSGRPIAWKHALTRNTAYTVTLGLSSLSSLFSHRGCSLHDQLAHTLSVRESRSKD